MAKLMPFAGTVLHNLLHKPVTTSYPDTPKEYPARTRGHVEVDMETCLLCGLCSRSCPPRAINVDRDAHTWSIHRFDCVQCGYCVEKCPKKCLKIVPGYPVPGHEKKLDIFLRILSIVTFEQLLFFWYSAKYALISSVVTFLTEFSV